MTGCTVLYGVLSITLLSLLSAAALCASQGNSSFKSSYSFAKPNKAKCLKVKPFKYPVPLVFTQLAARETEACELGQ